MVKWLHACPENRGLNGYMVKFVRLPFYEQSDMKRLSRTNPRFIGMVTWLNGYMPAPRIGGYMVTWLNS
jgi:hypothetical protein